MLSALAESDAPQAEKRAARIAACCGYTEVRHRGGGDIGVCPHRCRDRCCPTCAEWRSVDVAARAEAAVAKMDAPRFLTLTAPAIEAPLGEQLRGLRRAFTAIRKQGGWKARVRGGLYTVQITRNADTGRWHPHLHCIIDGEYLPQPQVKAMWRDALTAKSGLWSLGDDAAVIVDIRAIHSRSATARYVARYVCSPNELATWPAAAIVEYAEATRGVRMLTMFGSMHGQRLKQTPSDREYEPGDFIADITTAHNLARRGCSKCRAALRILGAAAPPLRRLTPWAIPCEDTPADGPSPLDVERAAALLRTAYLEGVPCAAREGRSGQAVWADTYNENVGRLSPDMHVQRTPARAADKPTRRKRERDSEQSQTQLFAEIHDSCSLDRKSSALGVHGRMRHTRRGVEMVY